MFDKIFNLSSNKMMNKKLMMEIVIKNNKIRIKNKNERKSNKKSRNIVK